MAITHYFRHMENWDWVKRKYLCHAGLVNRRGYYQRTKSRNGFIYMCLRLNIGQKYERGPYDMNGSGVEYRGS